MYPFIKISNLIYLPTFFVVISVAVSLSLLVFAKEIKNRGMDYSFHLNLALVLMGAGLIGGRLGHVFIEYPQYYLQEPEKVFYLWEGGYVFYGGFIAATLAGLFYFKKHHPNWELLSTTLDALAPAVSVSYAVGRWGCFFAGCCYGKSCDLAWAYQGHHPTQIYSSLWEFAILFLILGLSKRKPAPVAGLTFWIWALLHGVGRFWIELLREDFRGPDFIFSISGWISLILIFLSVYCLSQKVRTSSTT